MNDAIVPWAEIDDEGAEAAALKAAVAKVRADRPEVPDERMRAWLLKIAEGNLMRCRRFCACCDGAVAGDRLDIHATQIKNRRRDERSDALRWLDPSWSG